MTRGKASRAPAGSAIERRPASAVRVSVDRNVVQVGGKYNLGVNTGTVHYGVGAPPASSG